MALTARQKRALARLSSPALWVGHRGQRLLRQRRVGKLPLSSSRDGEDGLERILALRLDGIGDVLLSEPALEALHRRFPRARLDVAVSPRAAPLLLSNPHVDYVVEFEAPWHRSGQLADAGWWEGLRGTAHWVASLRHEEYDAAFELRGDLRDIVVAVASGARRVIGSSRRGGGYLLDEDAGPLWGVHQVEVALAIAGAAGERPAWRAPRVYLTEDALATAERHLGSGGRWVAFHLGGAFASKRLPLATARAAAAALCPPGGERRAVVVGGAEDAGLADAFAAGLSSEPLVLVGKLGLLETAAALSRCMLFVGGDSLPMHLAAAVGTPVVACFGPSDVAAFGPTGSPSRVLSAGFACSPCDFVHCVSGDYGCMQALSADEIVAAADSLLREVTQREPSRADG